MKYMFLKAAMNDEIFISRFEANGVWLKPIINHLCLPWLKPWLIQMITNIQNGKFTE